MQCKVTHRWGRLGACGLVFHVLALQYMPGSQLHRLWGGGGGGWTEHPAMIQRTMAIHTLCTRWGTMPLCQGGRSGIHRLIAWGGLLQ